MCLGRRAGHTGERTCVWEAGQDTHDDGHVGYVFFFTRLNVVRRHYVPVLHVEPVPARLRQLRVVVQELEQDAVQAVTPRPEPQHAAMERPKSCVNVRSTAQKKMRELLITRIYPARELFCITVLY